MTHVLNLLAAVPFFSRASSILSGVVLLVLVTAFLAALIERRSRTRTAHKLSSLKKLLPTTVRISRDGSEFFQTVDAIELGCIFVVRAGERFPTDGIIEDGAIILRDDRRRRKSPAKS